jgi:molybdopterin synthase sulfur carrier subunit
MVNVKVVFPSIFSKVTMGEREVYISALTFNEVLAKLVNRYGNDFKERIFEETGELRHLLAFYLNGRNVRFLDSLETELKNGDTISILPMASGG